MNQGIMQSHNQCNQAINTLINTHYQILAQYAKKLYINDAQLAEDLLQDTCERILKKSHLFKEGTNFRSWSKCVMKSIFLNQYKSNKRKTTSKTSIELFRTLKADTLSPESEMNRITIEEFIKTLSGREKVCFQLSLAGYKYKEIAEKIGVAIGTVKSTLSHARENLKNMIEQKNASSTSTLED